MNDYKRGPDFSGGPSRLFDELAKLATDAAGVAQGARREVETVFKSQAERFMDQMDLVQRDEFEAVKEMASRARMENQALREELDALKAEMAGGAKKPAAKKKPALKGD
ncbi:MAG: accessory factor UbiK family protein [Pseudomonadota bacterium]